MFEPKMAPQDESGAQGPLVTAAAVERGKFGSNCRFLTMEHWYRLREDWVPVQPYGSIALFTLRAVTTREI
jgi:hypothetical protein